MHVAKKTTIAIIFIVALLVCIMQNVQADVWSVDSESDWNNSEGTSYFSIINATGLLLNNTGDWFSIKTRSGEDSQSGTFIESWSTKETFNLNTSTYASARWNVTQKTNSGSVKCRITRSNGYSTDTTDAVTSTSYVNSGYSILDTGDWGSCTFDMYARPVGVTGYSKNWNIEVTNYSSIGLWNSSWHDFSTNNILNQVNFSVDSLGGGLKYKIDVSDDGVSVKDTTSWTSISSTGDTIQYPLLDAGRYFRISYNLTKGSTPLIDSFDIVVSENATPNIVSTYPVDATQGVSTSLSQINVTINDAEGDDFNWSIDTSPDVGNSSGFAASNGTKTCSITGLVGGTTYTVYVNISDSAGNILNYSFDFTTYGSVEFWCYDETAPSTGISPFGILISNGHAYENDSVNNGGSISISELPFGDNVAFVVSAEGYETRIYTYKINAVDDYNFSFYLPPETNSGLMKINSISVSNPAVDATVNLICEPETISLVQAWNESLYGHWYVIPDDKWSISGDTITIVNSVLDDNTTVVQVQYYCDDTVLDYIIHVVNNIGETLNGAKINVSIVYGTSYISVHSVLTDGNGDATVPLIPGEYYKISISKTGYITEAADYVPTDTVRTKTYKLDSETDDTNASNWMAFIDVSAELTSDCILHLNYTDSLINTTSVNVTVELWNGTAYNSTVYYYNSSSNSFNNNTGVSCLFGYRVEFNIDHGDYGVFTHTIMVNYQNGSIADVDTLESMFEEILGDNPFGWINFIAIFIMLAGLFAFGEAGAGISLLGTGFIFLFLNFLIVGFVVSTTIPILFVILGFLVEWQQVRRSRG